MDAINVITESGQKIAVANWSRGKLAFWRKAKGGAVYTELPAKEFKSAKAAAAYIGRCYGERVEIA